MLYSENKCNEKTCLLLGNYSYRHPRKWKCGHRNKAILKNEDFKFENHLYRFQINYKLICPVLFLCISRKFEVFSQLKSLLCSQMQAFRFLDVSPISLFLHCKILFPKYRHLCGVGCIFHPISIFCLL